MLSAASHMARSVHPKKAVLRFQDMDFEKGMQKSLKVIFKNIKALDENRNDISDHTHNPGVKITGRQQKQRSGSLPVQNTSHSSVTARQGSSIARKKKISL